MRRKAVRILAVVAIAGAVGAALWVCRQALREDVVQPAGGMRQEGSGLARPAQSQSLEASGYLEARQVSVASEVSGRVQQILATEGEPVVAGQLLVRLDESLVDAQVGLAESDLAVALAALHRAKARVRVESLLSAQAVLEEALACQAGALVTWQDARTLLDDPQEVELAVLALRAQVDVLGYQREQALGVANAAQAARDLADESLEYLLGFQPYDEWVLVCECEPGEIPPGVPLPPDLVDGEYYLGDYRIVIQGGKIAVFVKVRVDIPVDVLEAARQQQTEATYQSWAAWAGLAQADAMRAGAQEQLDLLELRADNPLDLQAQANAAEAQVQIAAAAVRLAESQVRGLLLGATPEQIAVAEAQVAIARAAVEHSEAERAKFSLRAPLSGVILEQPASRGEVAVPGVPLLVVADLGRLTLTAYVPANHLSHVRLGERVSVRVDAFPDQSFAGKVLFVAGEAEFTPKGVQTREEQASTVFAVTIELANPGALLKPGMSATAVFQGNDAAGGQQP